MLGIIIALVLAAWDALVANGTLVTAFFSAVDFLWVWYWIWTVVLGVFIGVMVLVITVGGGIAGADRLTRSRWLGGMVGLTAGGAISALIIVLTGIRSALLLIGVYLLKTAGNVGMVNFNEFDTKKLIFGSLLLLIGLILSRSSKSSSK